MHTYDDTETYASLVRTMPDLTGWSLGNLLGQYADLTSQHHDAMQRSEWPQGAESSELEAIEQDMAAVFNEIERRTLDRDTHVCRLGGVGIKELYVLASRLHVELSALVAAFVDVADAEVEQ